MKKIKFLRLCTLVVGKRTPEDIEWTDELIEIRNGQCFSCVIKQTNVSDRFDVKIGGKTYPHVPEEWFKVVPSKKAMAKARLIVLESFPEMMPATLAESGPDGSIWVCPETFNSLPVVRIKTPAFKVTGKDAPGPVVALRLAKDLNHELFYECVFFGSLR